jgi:hypothetical protein
MNVRLSFLLVAVLVIFGGTFLVFQLTRAEEPRQDPPWLFRMDDDSMVHIEVTHGGKTVTYRKTLGSYTWYIDEGDEQFPVFGEKWSGTTLLLSGPQVNRLLAETIENPSTYGFDPPSTIVKVTERTGISYEFHLGDNTPDGQNQYARLVGDSQLFTVPQIWGHVVNRLATQPPYPRLYYIDEDNSVVHVGVSHDGEIMDYGHRPDNGGWVALMEDGQELPVDAQRWEQVLPRLANPPVAQVETNRMTNAADYGLSPPRTWARVSTRNEDPYDFYLGDTTPDGERRYAQVRASQRLFTVSESWAQMLEGLVTDPLYTGAPEASPPDEATAEAPAEPDY